MLHPTEHILGKGWTKSKQWLQSIHALAFSVKKLSTDGNCLARWLDIEVSACSHALEIFRSKFPNSSPHWIKVGLNRVTKWWITKAQGIHQPCTCLIQDRSVREIKGRIIQLKRDKSVAEIPTLWWTKLNWAILHQDGDREGASTGNPEGERSYPDLGHQPSQKGERKKKSIFLKLKSRLNQNGKLFVTARSRRRGSRSSSSPPPCPSPLLSPPPDLAKSDSARARQARAPRLVGSLRHGKDRSKTPWGIGKHEDSAREERSVEGRGGETSKDAIFTPRFCFCSDAKQQPSAIWTPIHFLL